MAPRNDSGSSSESESDAPEAVSLSQSKKQVKKLEESRQNALKAERQSKRLQNQERDRKLKERADKNKELIKGKGKAKADAEELVSDDEDRDEADENGESAAALEKRMLRAMKEAQDESGEESDEEEYEGFEGFGNADDDQGSDEDSDPDNSQPDDDDDDETDEDEEEVEPPIKSVKTKFNPDHLPDEIFAAAFANQSTATKKKIQDTEDEELRSSGKGSRPNKRRKTSSKSAQDVFVGSRQIRVLPTSSRPPAPATLPSRKVKKFLDRTLALKGGKQLAKGWERRPVNLGVLRPNGGPAPNFVRNS